MTAESKASSPALWPRIAWYAACTSAEIDGKPHRMRGQGKIFGEDLEMLERQRANLLRYLIDGFSSSILMPAVCVHA